METKCPFICLPAKVLCLALVLLSIAAARGLAAGEKTRTAKASTAGSEAPAQAWPAPKPAEATRRLAGKRDPFRLPLPPREGKAEGASGPLPPGKRGLVVARLRLRGIVRQTDPQILIAVVTNEFNRAYFLRIQDEVYKGVVSEITENSIRFQHSRLAPDGQIEARETVLKMGLPPEEGK